MTVWSAPNYCYRFKNKATVCVLKENLDYEFVEFTANSHTEEIDNILNNELSEIQLKYFN